MVDSQSAIPIIDFDRLGVHRTAEQIDSAALQEVGEQLKQAFSKTGFCYLKNHGFNQNLVEQYRTVSLDFFMQPVEEKMKHAFREYFGWVSLEKEKPNPERPGDLKEAFNYIPARDTDEWSSSSAQFQQVSLEMFMRGKELAFRVCDALSVALNLRESFIRDAHKYVGSKDNISTLRSLYYPPIPPETMIKPNQVRLGEHSDYGTITMLFQDDVGGLEVEIPGTGFVPATPIPGTVVINIGDMMQRWTSDALIATKHRILIPESELKKRQPRQSIAFFFLPDNNYMNECVDGSNKYDPISTIDYNDHKFRYIH